jgi:hypothetical protein
MPSGDIHVLPNLRLLPVVLGLLLLALTVGGCATSAPTDPVAKEEYNKQKQQDLDRMIDEGMGMR